MACDFLNLSIVGVTYNIHMTVEDCFELGKIAYSEVDYYHTGLWMTQALRQLDEGEESTLDKVTVLDYLSYALYQQGEMERALEFTKKLLALGKSPCTLNTTFAAQFKQYHTALLTC